MNETFEILMLATFIAAICNILYHFLKNNETRDTSERTFTITMGLGFAIGVLKCIFTQASILLFALYLIGFMVSYTATLFSFPDQEIRQRKRKEEKTHE